MKRFLNFAVFALMFCWHAGAQEPRSLTGTEAEGYRGIWFTIGQARSGFGPKYSGGLGTYTMKHIPVAVYAAEADKTFFVYGGTPAGRPQIPALHGRLLRPQDGCCAAPS